MIVICETQNAHIVLKEKENTVFLIYAGETLYAYWNCEHRGVVLVYVHVSHMTYATYQRRQEIRQPYSWLSGT